jgi:hypothetical protein
MKLHWILNRYMAPAGDEGAAGGGADRGDDFVSTEDVTKVPTEELKKPDDVPETKEAAEAGLRGEAGEEKVDEEGDSKSRKDTRIPLARHKEILERERAARASVEQELARFKEGEKISQTNEKITEAEDKLLVLEQDYAKLLTDGNAAAAAAKMTEIRRMERGIIEAKSAMETQAATARAVEQVRYDMAVERIEEAYPQFSPESDDFDKEKVAEVLDLKEALQMKGYTPTDALQKAVKYVMGAATTKQETATEVTPRVSKEDAAAAAAAARKAEAVKRNTEVAGKQPPSTAKVGANHDAAGGTLDAKAVIKMPYELFKKLDDATLSKMRGDEFVGV